MFENMKNVIKRNNERKAFTLPEVLIVMVIVGVISVLMLTMVKPNDKALKYQYYNAYNTLQTAAFNIYQDVQDAILYDFKDKSKKFAEGTGSAASRDFCKKLAVQRGSEVSNEYGYINTIEWNCNSFSSVNESTTNFSSLTPAFIASNSMKYYISPLQTKQFPDTLSIGNSTTINYFIVWVDLNGDRRPNTNKMENENRPPDIVPFIVTTSGEIIPIGVPINDMRYMQAYVKIPTETSERHTNTMTYLNAQWKTFGGSEYPSVDHSSIKRGWASLYANKPIWPWAGFPKESPQTAADADCRVMTGEATECEIAIEEYKNAFQ